MKAIAYYRVAAEAQRGSIPEQRRQVRALGLQGGFDLVSETEERPGVAGGAERRPGGPDAEA